MSALRLFGSGRGASAGNRRRDTLARLKAWLTPRPRRLLLVFDGGGNTRSWRVAGQQLYRSDAVFRASIDAAEPIVRDMLGYSPIAAFGGDWAAASWHEERVTNIANVGLLHLAAFDSLAAAGVTFQGFAGVSLGETSAAYAAGVLSAREATTLVCALPKRLVHHRGEYVVFQARMDPADADALCRAPDSVLELAGEESLGVVELIASAANAEQARARLRACTSIVTERPSIWRYHVPGTSIDRAGLARDIAEVVPRLRDGARLYSAMLGGRVGPDYALDETYWAATAAAPHRFGSALAAAYADGHDGVVHVGHPTVGEWISDTAKSEGRAVHIVDCVRPGEDALDWQRRTRKLASARAAPPYVRAEAPVRAESIDLAAPEVAANPFPYYDALRREGAVHYLPRHGFWIVLRYDAVKAAFADPDAFSSAPYKDVDAVLLAADSPQHNAVRRAVARHFSAQVFDRLTDSAKRLAQSLIKPQVDSVAEFASPISRGVAADLLGFDDACMSRIAAAPDDVNARIRTLDGVAHHSALYSSLMQDGEAALDDARARSVVRLLWLAAVTTTERVIARCILRLLQDADLRHEVLADRALLPAVIEEVVRLYPPEHMVPRVTTAPTAIAGCAIPGGALVQLCVSAANRDPDAFADAATLRLDREGPRHFAFGIGIHQCLGAPLARRVVHSALGALLDRAPGFRAIEPLRDVRFFKTVTALTPARLVIGCE